MALFEVPGVNIANINISMHISLLGDTVLVVSGHRLRPYPFTETSNRSNPSECNPFNDTLSPSDHSRFDVYNVRELRYGRFRRELHLPRGASFDITASLLDGVLTVCCPRTSDNRATEFTEGPALNHPLAMAAACYYPVEPRTHS
ncbi:hypothetical protein C8R47DRAFT_1083441 [Mycena vitilis]|nr:hypothetical protein C8R47DRAFT_1083441 [Mycena vitilis]